VKYDGFGALFHGFRATILRDVPYSALQFAFYGKCFFLKKKSACAYTIPTIEQFKKFAKKNCVEPGQQLPLGIDLLTGSLAGGIAGAVTTPLDVVKTLLQTQPTDTKKLLINKDVVPPKHHYHGIIEGLVWNYRNQGLGGLFRGIGPRVFWTSLQSAIMFVIYEQVLHLEERLRKEDEWPPSQFVTQKMFY
jgi:hypothetical protein